MINLRFGEQTFTIKNQTNELLIGEFEQICLILNDQNDTKINKWSKVFKYLGIPEEIIDEFDSFDFIEIIKQFNIFDETLSTEFIKEININGKTYIANGDTFKITVKENGLIEDFIQINSEKYIGEMMAILYKLEGTDKSIWYDKTHIKHKADLFRKNITIDKAIPYITYLTKKMVNESNLTLNEL